MAALNAPIAQGFIQNGRDGGGGSVSKAVDIDKYPIQRKFEAFGHGFDNANIRLMSISADFGQPSSDGKEAPQKTLILDGIIQGERINLESMLAGYLMELKNSPLFDQPSIDRKSFEFFESREVLHFTAQLKLS